VFNILNPPSPSSPTVQRHPQVFYRGIRAFCGGPRAAVFATSLGLSAYMWTPKKRQRVTRACDLCKKKKKQCSGTQPCATCHSKSAPCTFSAPDQHQHQYQRQNQNPHSRTSHASHKHSDANAIDSLDPLLHHKAPRSNGEKVSGGVDSGQQPHAPPSPKESTGEDVTPIQNRGRLLQDGEGRLGEQYHLAIANVQSYSMHELQV